MPESSKSFVVETLHATSLPFPSHGIALIPKYSFLIPSPSVRLCKGAQPCAPTNLIPLLNFPFPYPHLPICNLSSSVNYDLKNPTAISDASFHRLVDFKSFVVQTLHATSLHFPYHC
jgi:hypothetical protein